MAAAPQSCVNFTEVLAIAQTIAGFGAIAAAIGLAVAQWFLARADKINAKRQFIDATLALIKVFDEETAKLAAATPNQPGGLIGTAKSEWLRWAMQVQSGMAALQSHAPADAPIIFGLTRCVLALETTSNFQMVFDHSALVAAAEHVRDNLNKEAAYLRSLRPRIRPT